MKTITKCFLLIAILCALTLANFHFFLSDLFNGYSWGALLTFIGIVAGVWSINFLYIKAKRIEEQMRRDIQSLMNLQAFALLRMTFENQPDFNQNGFGAIQKDKTDEVEADK